MNCDRKKPTPLKSKTMTLGELQLAVIKLCREVRIQFNRAAYEDGMSDNEFLDRIVEPLKTRIHRDRDVIKSAKRNRSKATDKSPGDDGHGPFRR